MKTTDVESRPNLLIPEDKAPHCYALGCRFEVVAGDLTKGEDLTHIPFDVFNLSGASFVHIPRSGKRSAFFIPEAHMLDLYHNLWLDMKPWIDQLHAEDVA